MNITKKGRVTTNWEVPVCNNCHNKIQTVLWNDLTYWEYPGVFQIVQCSECGLVYTSPRPKPSQIGKYYVQENYWGRNVEDLQALFNDDKERAAYSPMYNIIRKYKRKGKILDIGAGTGVFLSKFKNEGWKVEGVELMESAARYAKEHFGIVMKQGDFFNFSLPSNSFDVVALNGSLEHLYTPLETLSGIQKILKKDGIIIFSVPNYDSIGRKVFGKNWFAFQPPRHLYHYSPRVIRQMLKNAGYKNIRISYKFWLQNHYILFQSLRFSKSPKFVKRNTGGLLNTSVPKKRSWSPKIVIGKLLGYAFAYGTAALEPFLKQGEVMIVYAQKN